MAKKGSTAKDKNSNRRDSTSYDKGKMVEQIVADLYEHPNLKVKQRAFLAPVSGIGGKREIDVYATTQVAGLTIKIGIECKNEGLPIKPERIDAFVTKLKYVGIPVQQGIYVSASGYTQRALEVANHFGIQPLTLFGLSKDRLYSAVEEAFKSVIYLLPIVESFSISNDPSSPEDDPARYLIYDGGGTPQGYIFDPIYYEWLKETIPSEIGEYGLDFVVPTGTHQLVNGKVETILSFNARIRVIGLALTFKGEMRQHALVNAATKQFNKGKIEARFENKPGTYPLTTLNTEAELEEFLSEQKPFRVTIERVRLPRLRSGASYWPPSERIIREIEMLHKTGTTIDSITLAAIEGTDLKSIWDPIWKEHPIVKLQGIEEQT